MDDLCSLALTSHDVRVSIQLILELLTPSSSSLHNRLSINSNGRVQMYDRTVPEWRELWCPTQIIEYLIHYKRLSPHPTSVQGHTDCPISWARQ